MTRLGRLRWRIDGKISSPMAKSGVYYARRNNGMASTFFISYAREDSQFALRLANDLKSKDIDVWLDQLKIRPGMQWDREVQRALNLSSGIIVVLSPASVASDHVMDEVAFGLDQGKKVIPVFCADCEIPFSLRRRQHIDFRLDYDNGLRCLLREIEGHDPEPLPPDPRHSNLELTLHLPEGKIVPVVAPNDKNTGEFLRELVANVPLPVADDQGNQLEWRAENKDLGRFLAPDKTLQENGTSQKSHLYLTSRLAAPPPPMPAKCAHCGAILEGSAQFCPACGNPVIEEKRKEPVKNTEPVADLFKPPEPSPSRRVLVVGAIVGALVLLYILIPHPPVEDGKKTTEYPPPPPPSLTKPVIQTATPSQDGTLVTINGSNFQAQNTQTVVKLGGQQLELTAINNYQITASIPGGASGWQMLQVCTAAVCSDATRVFVPSSNQPSSGPSPPAPSPPTISSVDPRMGIPGTSVFHVAGSGFVPGHTLVRFGTLSANPIGNMTNGDLFVRLPAGLGSGILSVQVCTSIGTGCSRPENITVIPRPNTR
jgi:hypothetical protein